MPRAMGIMYNVDEVLQRGRVDVAFRLIIAADAVEAAVKLFGSGHGCTGNLSGGIQLFLFHENAVAAIIALNIANPPPVSSKPIAKNPIAARANTTAASKR